MVVAIILNHVKREKLNVKRQCTRHYYLTFVISVFVLNLKSKI